MSDPIKMSAGSVIGPVGRRGFLGGAAAAAILPVAAPILGARPALASTETGLEPAAPHGGGYYRFKVGSFTVTVISDGDARFPAYPTFGENVDKATYEAAIRDHFLSADQFVAHLNVMAIDTGDHLVLVDAGTAGAFGPTTGKLVANLANAGIDPARVDTILLSHAHIDHIAGLTTPDGALAFPNAQYFVHEDEYAFWMNPPAGAPENFVAAAQKGLNAIKDKSSFFAGQAQVAPGIWATAAPGHTPGHSAVMIDDGSAQLLHVVDAVHHFVTALSHPDWHVQFDVDKELAVETRKRIIDGAATDRMMVATYHFPFPGIGHIARHGNGYVWVPKVWEW